LISLKVVVIRAIVIFLLFILAAILGGAIFAYPIQLLFNDAIPIPYHKLITHITLLFGLIASALYLWINNLFNKSSFGYDLHRKLFAQNLLLGFGIGLLIIVVVETCLLILHVHVPDPDLVIGWQVIMIVIVKALLVGIVVGFIEETIFRGALLSGLLEKTNVCLAVSMSSLVYAAVHFLKYRALEPGTEIHWYTGLEMLPKALFRFSDPVIVDTFSTLFMFGVLLALIRIRNNNIAWCIGIHAGVVAAIKLFRHFMDHAPDSKYLFLVNDYNNLMGWLTFFWLLIITAIYYWRKIPASHTGS
jgi:membrane protease YdiL (CAAX protease family)